MENAKNMRQGFSHAKVSCTMACNKLCDHWELFPNTMILLPNFRCCGHVNASLKNFYCKIRDMG